MKRVALFFRFIAIFTVFSVVPVFLAGGLIAQTPTHYPTGSNPQPFTLPNILVYIVFPVLLVVAWIVVKRLQRKRMENPDK